jgi:hypothetical protein
VKCLTSAWSYWRLYVYPLEISQYLTWRENLDDRRHNHRAAMAECLCCLARTTRHRMTLDKSLTTVCLGSPGRCILITCDIHRPLWLVCGQSVCMGELKRLSRRTLRQACLLSRATASNSCRENIRLSKLSPDSILYR